MRTTRYLAAFALAFIANPSGALQAALSGTTTLMASGLSSPVFATFAPNDPNHLFVVQKGGAVRVVDLNTKSVLSTPFLTIDDTKSPNEGGFLGLAFHPNYANPGKQGYGQFYVYVTVENGGVSVTGHTAPSATSPFSTHVRSYTVSPTNPLVANAGSVQEIMSWPRPQDNHVGGWIGFGPKDGYLYINSGDGGNGNDQGAGHWEAGGNAQNIADSPNDFMGKQLRIDINSDAFPGDATKNYAIPATNPFAGATTGADEIWNYGLRNPYRGSFDRDTGNEWIGDVGQQTREEIDFQAANSAGGINYGWRLREGKIATPTGNPVVGGTCSGCTDPVYDYASSGNAVIGGYVYRGPDPSLQGTYFFADEVTSQYSQMNTSTFAVTNIKSMLVPNAGSLDNPSSFAEDAVGNLYIVTLGGNVLKINTNQLLAGDLTASGTVDAGDYVTWRKSGSGTYANWRQNFGQTVHTSGSGAAELVPEMSTGLLMCEMFVLLSIYLLPRRARFQPVFDSARRAT